MKSHHLICLPRVFNPIIQVIDNLRAILFRNTPSGILISGPFILVFCLFQSCTGNYYNEKLTDGLFKPIHDIILKSPEYVEIEKYEQDRRAAQANFDNKLFEEARAKKDEINGVLVERVNQKLAGNFEIPVTVKANKKIKSISPLIFKRLINIVSGDFAQINAQFEIRIELMEPPAKFDYARLEFLNSEGYPMLTAHPIISNHEDGIIEFIINYDNLRSSISTLTVEIP